MGAQRDKNTFDSIEPLPFANNRLVAKTNKQEIKEKEEAFIAENSKTVGHQSYFEAVALVLLHCFNGVIFFPFNFL